MRLKSADIKSLASMYAWLEERGRSGPSFLLELAYQERHYHDLIRL